MTARPKAPGLKSLEAIRDRSSHPRSVVLLTREGAAIVVSRILSSWAGHMPLVRLTLALQALKGMRCRGRGYFTGLWRRNSRYLCQIKTMTIRSAAAVAAPADRLGESVIGAMRK
jgi:hypothetical protein